MEEIEVVKVKFLERECTCETFTFDAVDEGLRIGDYCVAKKSEDDELDYGQVVGKFRIPKQKFSRSMQKIIRKATEEDKKCFEESKRKETEACEICRKKIKDRGLPMKLVKSRYSLDGSKITFYFTSERRVDFRDLVKDLAHIFKCRIELRQIGVKNEAKAIGGYGSCGRPLCCTTFLKKFGRISIRMAKDQNMTLTPSKISGICGRLLCCLEYESEWYQKVRELMPEIGSTVKTKNTSGKVEEIDPFHGTVKVRNDNGELIEVDVEDL